MRSEILTASAPKVAPAAAIVTSSLLSDAFMVDALIAILCGFVAMAPTDGQSVPKFWEGAVGMALGLVAGLIMRSGEFSDLSVRVGIAICALLSTKVVIWLRHPEQGLKALQAFAGMVQKVMSILSGK